MNTTSQGNGIKPETLGIAAELQAQLGTLQSIKSSERSWIDRYTILILPAIVYLLMLSINDSSVDLVLLNVMAVFFFVLALWFQNVLRKERLSYYRILRSVSRAENHLGLFQINFKPEAFADAFPIGMGPNPDKDGTQPYSSFLLRQIYTITLYLILLVEIILLDWRSVPILVFLVLDILWIIRLFRIDKKQLYRESLGEKGLLGAPPKWFSRVQIDKN